MVGKDLSEWERELDRELEQLVADLRLPDLADRQRGGWPFDAVETLLLMGICLLTTALGLMIGWWA